MFDSPHTSAPMRVNTPPTTRSPPHQSRPAGYPPNRQPATVGEEERGGRGTKSRRTSTRAAPERRPPLTARHAPLPRTSTSQGRGPEPAQDRRAAPRGRRRAAPGSSPRSRPPRRHKPPRHAPRQQQQDGGKADVLSSATGPSTARCRKNVTTHQHRPGARPGRPCPVPGRRINDVLAHDDNVFYLFLQKQNRSRAPYVP
jgi:hypothetical protein